MGEKKNDALNEEALTQVTGGSEPLQPDKPYALPRELNIPASPWEPIPTPDLNIPTEPTIELPLDQVAPIKPGKYEVVVDPIVPPDNDLLPLP